MYAQIYYLAFPLRGVFFLFKCPHTIAYGINVYERMLKRSPTLRLGGTLDIRRVLHLF